MTNSSVLRRPVSSSWRRARVLLTNQRMPSSTTTTTTTTTATTSTLSSLRRSMGTLAHSSVPTGHSCAVSSSSWRPHSQYLLQYPSLRFFASDASTNDDKKNRSDKKDDKKKNKKDDKKTVEETKTNKESMEFQAETKQLLDIVTHSLYTDKEVFLRELVSNASDACEKLRHLQSTTTQPIQDPDIPLEIRIETDEMNSTLTISDTGIGLTRQDMITNLGTIAKSGSKAFVQELTRKASSTHDDQGSGELDMSKGIIGRFGVGFYSAFMVGDSVEVRSKSAVVHNHKTNHQESSSTPQHWVSQGVGSFDISDLHADVRQDRGSSIVIHLKDEYPQYADEKTIESILKKYSNFVNFPIFLNGNRVNTMEAIWAKDAKEVDEDTYSSFYKYIANAYDEPLDVLHYKADAPIDIKALFYIPSFHSEKYGMERMGPGVSLYSRKVLIEHKSQDILPDWLRFIKGVVDSEDLPLSISREKAQDTALIQKLRKALTRKIITHITKMAKKQTDRYKDEFYGEYQFFLKEGICQDYEFQEPLSKLLYFETSKTPKGEITSFDEYVGRMTPDQKEIYYLCAPSRDLALESPYLEVFEQSGKEVIFVYSAIDDFVMANLEKYQGRTLISAEKSDIDVVNNNHDDGKDKDGDDKDGEDSSSSSSPTKLSTEEATELCAWIQKTMPEQVSICKVTTRLASSPAVVTDNESSAMRRMMRMVDADSQSGGREGMPLPKQQLEINPNHPIIVGIHSIKDKEPTLAKVLTAQIFDNCLMAAGLLDDSRSMLPRLNDILLTVVKGANDHVSADSSDSGGDTATEEDDATTTTTGTTTTTDRKKEE